MYIYIYIYTVLCDAGFQVVKIHTYAQAKIVFLEVFYQNIKNKKTCMFILLHIIF